jgi:hypothetical protein
MTLPVPGSMDFKLSSIGLPEHSRVKWQKCSNCFHQFPMRPEQAFIKACNGNGKHVTSGSPPMW